MQNSSLEILEVEPGRCQIRGPLTFATARLARDAGERCLLASEASEVELDCAQVTDADSAGLAVLLDWKATARLKGRQLRYRNIPAEISAVARISEVEDLLGA